MFCGFLALMLKSELEERIAGLGRSGSWPEIIADLHSLTETEIEYDGKRFIVRSAPRPSASVALRAAGVALANDIGKCFGFDINVTSATIDSQRSQKSGTSP